MAQKTLKSSWTGTPGYTTDEESWESHEERCLLHEEEDNFTPVGVRTTPDEIRRAKDWLKTLSQDDIVLLYRRRHEA